MSQLEKDLIETLSQNNVEFETQKPIPCGDYPWKTDRSRSNPKCDIYLRKEELYIEVKGFMTVEAMSKMEFCANQDFKYYIFQGTEKEWDPWLDSSFSFNEEAPMTTRKTINHQIQELVNLEKHPEFLQRISEITMKRLEAFYFRKQFQYESYKEYNK